MQGVHCKGSPHDTLLSPSGLMGTLVGESPREPDKADTGGQGRPAERVRTSSRDSRAASSLCALSCMALSVSSRWRVICSTWPGTRWERGGQVPHPGRQASLGDPVPSKGLPQVASQEVEMEGTGQRHAPGGMGHTLLCCGPRAVGVPSRVWSGSGSGICWGWWRTATQHPKAGEQSRARGVLWGHQAALRHLQAPGRQWREKEAT